MTSTAPAEHLSLEEAAALAQAVAPQDAADRVAAGAVLIDVRSAAGRARTGEIPGAHVVDRYAVDEQLDLASAARLAPVLSLDTPIVVVCGSVRGSGPVAAALREKGFTQVVHVDGGAGAWRDAGLPFDAALEVAATDVAVPDVAVSDVAVPDVAVPQVARSEVSAPEPGAEIR